MAITYVGGFSAGGTGASYTVSLNGTLTGGSDSSPQTGDLIVVCAAHGATASSAPTCSGNTSGAYQTVHAALYSNDTWDTNMRTFYQFAGVTPDITLTIARTNNTTFGGAPAVQVWRGVNPATPIDATANTASAANQSASRPDAPSHQPVTTGAIVIACGAGMQTTAGAAFTIPSGMSNGVSQHFDGSTSDIGTFMASFAWTSGAYNPAAVTGGTTSTSGSHASATFSLRPSIDHPVTGALSGPGSAIVGSAARASASVSHATTGVLAGPGSAIAGSASSATTRAATGVLSGQGSAVAGSAARTRAHPAAGEIIGPAAALSGSAERVRIHGASGVLAGADAALSGSAARVRIHGASGILAGLEAAIAGDAARTGGVVSHDTSGVLSGSGSLVVGSAARFRQMAASGVLAGTTSVVAGSAARDRIHANEGALVGGGAAIAGSAARTAAPAVHATSGELAGPDAIIVGHAARIGAPVTHGTSGELGGSGATVAGMASTPGSEQPKVSGGIAAKRRPWRTRPIVLAPVENNSARIHQCGGALSGAGAAVVASAMEMGEGPQKKRRRRTLTVLTMD